MSFLALSPSTLSFTVLLMLAVLVGYWILTQQPAISTAVLLRANPQNYRRPAQVDEALAILARSIHYATASPPENPNAPYSPRGDSARMPRPWWGYLGLGHRPPAQPVVGVNARVRWWQRLRAIIGLAIIVVLLGIAVAALIGAMVFLAGYLLETAVS